MFNEKLFEEDFGEALAVLLHEWNHIYGYDGSRSFSDALTDSMVSIINKREIIDKYEDNWNKKREIILKEREKTPVNYIDIFMNLEKEDMKKVVLELSKHELRRKMLDLGYVE